MAYCFMTKNSVYEVSNGRMTRYTFDDKDEILDHNIGAVVHAAIKDELVEIPHKPTVGRPCQFVIKSEGHNLFGQPITTSAVNMVADVVDVTYETC